MFAAGPMFGDLCSVPYDTMCAVRCVLCDVCGAMCAVPCSLVRWLLRCVELQVDLRGGILLTPPHWAVDELPVQLAPKLAKREYGSAALQAVHMAATRAWRTTDGRAQGGSGKSGVTTVQLVWAVTSEAALAGVELLMAALAGVELAAREEGGSSERGARVMAIILIGVVGGCLLILARRHLLKFTSCGLWKTQYHYVHGTDVSFPEVVDCIGDSIGPADGIFGVCRTELNSTRCQQSRISAERSTAKPEQHARPEAQWKCSAKGEAVGVCGPCSELVLVNRGEIEARPGRDSPVGRGGVNCCPAIAAGECEPC